MEFEIRSLQTFSFSFNLSLAASSVFFLTSVFPPLGNHATQIRRQLRRKENWLVGDRMNESQGACMQRLAREHLKTVHHKLFVFGKDRPLEDPVATI